MDKDALSQMSMTFKGVYFCLKRYLKLRFVFVLCLVLSLTFVHPFAVYADVNNLLIGTSSNALMTLDLIDEEYGVSTFSSLATVTNTINYDNAFMWIRRRDTETGVVIHDNVSLSGMGYANYFVPDGYEVFSIGLHLMRGAIPSAGTYSYEFDFTADMSVDYTAAHVMSYRDVPNASRIIKSNGLIYTESSGDFYSTNTIQIGAINDLFFYMNFDPLSSGSAVGGYFDLSFVVSDVTDPYYETAGIGMSDTGYQDDVSSSLSDLSSSVDTMTDEISGVTEAIQNLQGAMEPHYSNVLTQLHHITEQLHAFYDQVYNNIHLVELDILEGILAAIENMDLEVNVELGGLKQTIERVSTEIQANDNKLSAEQIASDEANTEEIKDAVEEHGNFIIDGLKGLFIPSDEFFKSYFDDLYEYFSDRFGFLSFPFDLLARFVDLVINSSDVDCVLTLPSFEIMGEQLLYENSFNLTEFLEQNFGFLLSVIRMGTSIILIMSFVQLCGDKWKEVMIR